MVAAEHYNTPSTALHQFLLDKNFRIPGIQDVMNSVFGTDRTGVEAMSWAHYWNELSMNYILQVLQGMCQWYMNVFFWFEMHPNDT